ncbi:MAG: transporter [Piscirickettsiaceae bacterium]|nr:transporter [Piscirickettsiaceae bacterium]
MKQSLIILFFTFISFMPSSYAMELEPLRWSHLPIGINFAGGGYAYTEANIFVDPVILLEDVDMELHTWAAKYIRTFSLFDKSARIDLSQSYQEGKWTGLVNGSPASISRKGLSDSFLRLAVNLYGSPPLTGKDFFAYRANTDVETIIGFALAIRLPTGDYMDDKLINLGQNRLVFRPQLGVTHKRGKWTSELTAEVAFHTDNDDFFNGKTREQEPLYIIHGHIIHTFRPGVWAGLSIGYDYGGESSVNGVNSDDKKQDIGWALSFTYPIERYSLKVAYIGTRTQEDVGLDTDTLVASLSFLW